MKRYGKFDTYDRINEVLARYKAKADSFSDVKKLRMEGLSFTEIAKKLGRDEVQLRNQTWRYTGASPITVDCYSCLSPKVTFSKRKFNFCSTCWTMFFVRESGTELEGMDFTREIVRIRDKHTCTELAGGCGRVWKLGERRFDIHHWDGSCGKFSRSYDKVKNINNLITLCHKCHLNLPEVKDKMFQKSSPREDNQKLYQEKWRRKNKPWLK